MSTETPSLPPSTVLPFPPAGSASAAPGVAVASGENDPALQRRVDLRVEAALKEVLLGHDYTRPANRVGPSRQTL